MAKDEMINKLDIFRYDWDIFIHLDGCRFDYFKRVLDEDGFPFDYDLYRMNSPFKATRDFYMHYFKDMDRDLGNHILLTQEVTTKDIADISKFFKVIEMWKTDWCDKFGIIMPKDVFRIAKSEIRLNKDKKFIIQFLQPHEPFLTLDLTDGCHSLDDLLNENFRKRSVFREYPARLLHRIFSTMTILDICSFFGIESKGYYGKLYQRYGVEFIREAYRNNIRIGLFYVMKLCQSFPSKKFMISSDHAVVLGDNGEFENRRGKPHIKEIEVPVMLVNRRG